MLDTFFSVKSHIDKRFYSLSASSDPPYLSPAAHGVLPWRERVSLFHKSLFLFNTNQLLSPNYSNLLLTVLLQT